MAASILLVALLGSGAWELRDSMSSGSLVSGVSLREAIRFGCQDLAADVANERLWGVYEPLRAITFTRPAGAADSGELELSTDAARDVNASFLHEVIAQKRQAASGSGSCFSFALDTEETERVGDSWLKALEAYEDGLVRKEELEEFFTGTPSEYLLHAAWTWIGGDPDDPYDRTAQLELCILKSVGKQKRAMAEPRRFVHPRDVEARRDLRFSRRLVFAGASIGLLGLAVWFSLRRSRCRSRRTAVLQAVARDLEDEHYRAARGRLLSHLTYCPSDFEAERLLALVPAKPRLAERAAEARRSLSRATREIEERGDATDLTLEPWWGRIKRLVPHDPRGQLEAAVSAYRKAREATRVRDRARRIYQEFQKELGLGRLESASRCVVTLKQTETMPDRPLFQEARADLEAAMEDARQWLARSRGLLDSLHPDRALEAIERACEADIEREEPILLRDRIRSSQHVLSLVPEAGGRPLLVVARQVLCFGRTEADICIAHPQVSARHLEVAVVGARVIARDLGSRNGTYHRGRKITVVEIDDGDILDLGGVCPLVVHIEREAAPEGDSPDPGIASGTSVRGVFFEGPEEVDTALVVSELSFSRTALAFHPMAKSEGRFRALDGYVTLQLSGGREEILLVDGTVRLSDQSFRVEEFRGVSGAAGETEASADSGDHRS